MNARACVTTAKTAAAIASVGVTGPDAHKIIKKILAPSAFRQMPLEIGGLLVGNIVDNDRIIDHVVVARQTHDSFEISCHGNPLIVEAIMILLQTKGAELVSCEEILKETAAATSQNAIEAEAKFHLQKVATIQGFKIIAAQIQTGLLSMVQHWLEDLDNLSLTQITDEAKQILAESIPARFVINGCKVIIAGAPNSGKSTLLNCLAGKQKAIVTDMAGTTRDWVSATCRLGPLLVELTDTAGLDRTLKKLSDIDSQAQNRTLELVSECDLILHVVDGSLSGQIEQLKTDKPVLTVINKTDLGCAVAGSTPNHVKISAKAETGIKELTDGIMTVLGVSTLDASLPVCFTERQKQLLNQVAATNAKTRAKSLITELLSGPVCV